MGQGGVNSLLLIWIDTRPYAQGKGFFPRHHGIVGATKVSAQTFVAGDGPLLYKQDSTMGRWFGPCGVTGQPPKRRSKTQGGDGTDAQNR
jgi:hypothetical protein